MRKPAPYCTPAMLKALRAYASPVPAVNVPRNVLESLRSRGWLDARHCVTTKGRAYLKQREARS